MNIYQILHRCLHTNCRFDLEVVPKWMHALLLKSLGLLFLFLQTKVKVHSGYLNYYYYYYWRNANKSDISHHTDVLFRNFFLIRLRVLINNFMVRVILNHLLPCAKTSYKWLCKSPRKKVQDRKNNKSSHQKVGVFGST